MSLQHLIDLLDDSELENGDAVMLMAKAWCEVMREGIPTDEFVRVFKETCAEDEGAWDEFVLTCREVAS